MDSFITAIQSGPTEVGYLGTQVGAAPLQIGYGLLIKVLSDETVKSKLSEILTQENYVNENGNEEVKRIFDFLKQLNNFHNASVTMVSSFNELPFDMSLNKKTSFSLNYVIPYVNKVTENMSEWIQRMYEAIPKNE